MQLKPTQPVVIQWLQKNSIFTLESAQSVIMALQITATWHQRAL